MFLKSISKLSFFTKKEENWKCPQGEIEKLIWTDQNIPGIIWSYERHLDPLTDTKISNFKLPWIQKKKGLKCSQRII